MKNRVFRYFDSQGRITIPSFLVEITEIKRGTSIAFISVEEDMISIVPYDKSTGMKIIYKSTVGDKNRIIIPKELRDGIEKVEIFLYNGYITLK